MNSDLLLECPYCRRVNEAHDGPTDEDRPVDGNVSMCLLCGGLGIYVGDPVSLIRKPTPVELDELMADDNVRMALTALHLGGGDVQTVVDNYRRALG